jgi:hypothetical protein
MLGRVGNAKMLPCRHPDKLKPSNGAGFIEGRFRGTKNCIRTAREKTLPFPPITVELASILRCIRSHQGLWGGRLNTGLRLFRLRKTQYAFESNRNHKLVGPGQVFRQTLFRSLCVVISNR